MTHLKITQKIKTNSYIATLSLVIAILISSMAFSQDTVSNVGTLSFDKEIIDYGTIHQNDDGLRTFTFENTGNAPIVISKVKTSCGCTVPNYSKEAILPGATSSIEIKYATSRIGKFTKSITVYSNADTSEKILKIKGNVVSKSSLAAK